MMAAAGLGPRLQRQAGRARAGGPGHRARRSARGHPAAALNRGRHWSECRQHWVASRYGHHPRTRTLARRVVVGRRDPRSREGRPHRSRAHDARRRRPGIRSRPTSASPTGSAAVVDEIDRAQRTRRARRPQRRRQRRLRRRRRAARARRARRLRRHLPARRRRVDLGVPGGGRRDPVPRMGLLRRARGRRPRRRHPRGGGRSARGRCPSRCRPTRCASATSAAAPCRSTMLTGTVPAAEIEGIIAAAPDWAAELAALSDLEIVELELRPLAAVLDARRAREPRSSRRSTRPAPLRARGRSGSVPHAEAAVDGDDGARRCRRRRPRRSR